jgi:ubiquinone/menaquinone biosynthesis C-methylase UbiE
MNLRQDQEILKQDVAAFWEEGSCGEVYAVGASPLERMEAHAAARYTLEPYIRNFAHFEAAEGKDVLEIGVGMGADHCEWARCRPRSLTGVDLTRRAIDFTRERLALHGLDSRLEVSDAENLPFEDSSFDLVYSWGVLHHTPDTPRAIREVYRVLRPGGRALVMVYNRYSIVGSMLWLRYALLKGRPMTGLNEIYAKHLESPGTKAYTPRDARSLFRDFARVETSIRLSGGDTLEGAAGQRHQGMLLRVARAIWPRRIIRTFLPSRGLFLLIEAVK